MFIGRITVNNYYCHEFCFTAFIMMYSKTLVFILELKGQDIKSFLSLYPFLLLNIFGIICLCNIYVCLCMCVCIYKHIYICILYTYMYMLYICLCILYTYMYILYICLCIYMGMCVYS